MVDYARAHQHLLTDYSAGQPKIAAIPLALARRRQPVVVANDAHQWKLTMRAFVQMLAV